MTAFNPSYGPRVASLPFLALLAGGCSIGFAAILVRLSETGPVASAFWRTAIAAPLLWAWAWQSAAKQPGRSGRLPGAALWAAGLFFAADLGVWHWSIAWTSVANATLLANLAPIWVTLAGVVFFRQRVSPLFLVGMTAAIGGMFVLVGPNFAVGGAPLMGDALGAITALFYAGYMLSIKSARDSGVSTARLMAWSTTITALALLPAALLSDQPFMPADARGWAVLVALALVTQVVGQGLIAYAFAHLSAALSSVSLLIQPVTAAVFAWILLGEAIGPAQAIGGLVVLAGIWMARRAGG